MVYFAKSKVVRISLISIFVPLSAALARLKICPSKTDGEKDSRGARNRKIFRMATRYLAHAFGKQSPRKAGKRGNTC